MTTRNGKRQGQGSVWKEGTGYRARDPTGKRKRFPSRRKANDWLAQRRALIRQEGLDKHTLTGSRPELTFEQLWKWYVRDIQPAKTASTRRIETQAWKRCLRWIPEGRSQPFWKTARVAHLKTADVTAYRAWRAQSGHSPATIAQELSTLRQLTHLAEENDLCKAPKVRWKVPGPVSRRPALVEEATFKRLLAAASPRNAALIRWLWDTGARPNELLGVRRKDYDPQRGTVFIPTPKTGTKTGIAGREFPLTAEMKEAIETRDAWLKRVAKGETGLYGTGKRRARTQLDSDWLFPASNGKRYAKDGYRPALKSTFQKVGVNLDLYAFRHTYCTRWISSGGDLFTLAKMVGTSVEMISKTYGQVDLDRVRQIQSRMGSTPSDETRERPARPYTAGRTRLKAV